MICISLSKSSFPQLLQQVEKAGMAEIRLDLLSLSSNEIQQLFTVHGKKLIAACRPGTHSDVERMNILKLAVDNGCAYVDMEIDAPGAFLDELIPYAKKKGCNVILSYHNFESMPEKEALMLVIMECMLCGADIVKIAVRTQSEAEVAMLLSLYAGYENLVAIGMGEKGKISRIASLFLGAPFTYAAPDDGEPTAPGQFTESEMRELLRLIR